MFGSGANTGFGGFGGASNGLGTATPAWGQAPSSQVVTNPANEWLGDGTGTSIHPFKPTHSKEPQASYTNVYLQSIMMQPEYKKFNHEELRMQDYLQGRVFGEDPEANSNHHSVDMLTLIGPRPNNGTRAHPFAETRDKDPIQNTIIMYQSITFMPQYKGNSIEELRMEDYRQGLVFASNQPALNTTPSGFGSSVLSNTSRPAGFGSAAPAFGATSTAPTGFGTNTIASSGFSSSTFGTASVFGAKPSTGFGAATTTAAGFGAQPASGFGSQSTSAFGSSASGGFGATSSANPFGNSTGQSKPAFGFGSAAPPQTGFGSATNPTGGSGFGTSSGFGTAATGFGSTAAKGFGTTGFGNTASTGLGTGTATGFGNASSAGFGNATATGFGTAGFGAQSAPATGFGNAAPVGFGNATSVGFGVQSTTPFGNNQASGSIFGAKPTTGTGFMTSQPTNTFGTFGQANSSFSGFSNPQANSFAASVPPQPTKPSAASLNPYGDILLFEEMLKANPKILDPKPEPAKSAPVQENAQVAPEEDSFDINVDEFFEQPLSQSLYHELPTRRHSAFVPQYFTPSETNSFAAFDSAPFLAPPLRYNVPLRQANARTEPVCNPPISATIAPANRHNS